MALYFFHLCDGGDTLLDAEGREIADLALIPAMTLKDARGMISADALEGRLDLSAFIQVRDNSGTLVHELAFRDAITIR